jgi:exopolyphosphatase / guanosine-5'-triphosphate,3'-diphosphate pyrophosphatase
VIKASLLASPLVLPRWEWRTLASSLPDLRERLSGVSMDSVRLIRETYLLCQKSSHNAKIRNGVLDLKWRKQVNAQGLELWDPVLKTGFPCRADLLPQLFGAWAIPMPALVRDSYTQDQFLQEIILPNGDLKPLEVQKVREGFTLDGTTCEFAGITAGDFRLDSFCVEHEDPQLVLNVLRRLDLDSRHNLNYPEALKRALNRWAA